MSVPQIQSIGPPPELHVDRVVGEMIRWLIQARARMWPSFWKAVRDGNFGNPKGQQRVVAKLRLAGHPFLTGIELEPAKRCRYSLAIDEIEGFDPDTQQSIDDEELLIVCRVGPGWRCALPISKAGVPAASLTSR
jgi:hypothetical protein